MYEKHFGLRKRPFRAQATGTDVFIGPQTAAIVAGLKTTLTARDAIVSVSGPVGSGKSTLVGKSLSTIGENRTVIRIGRMRVGMNDVLDLLLEELRVQSPPTGTIRKITAFRQRLSELENSDTRVFIVVEDGQRLGMEILAELEALTAADAGASEGANIVVMGDEKLDDVLRDPQLTRFAQRIRQRHSIAELNLAELRGYLRHCFRLVGGDFEALFESDAVHLLHYLSGGIPRIVNNLVESAMSMAAGESQQSVPSSLIRRVALNEYGLSSDDFAAPPKPTVSAPQAVPAARPVPKPQVVPVIKPKPAATAPVVVFSKEPESPTDDAEIPQFIEDTLPSLEILTPEFAFSEEEPEPVPELAIAPVTAPEPAAELQLEATPGDPVSTAVPDWDRDPTLAELKPDLAALEQAMALTQRNADEPAANKPAGIGSPPRQAPAKEEIPEITLDFAIKQKIEDKLIDERGEISPPGSENVTPATPVPDVNRQTQKNDAADVEAGKIAKELSKARSIEDIDDKMAETLFGEDFSQIAAQIAANPPPIDSATDEPPAEKAEPGTAPPVAPVAAARPVVVEKKTAPEAARSAPVEVILEAPPAAPPPVGIDLFSTQQRLETVRALNAAANASAPKPQPRAANESMPKPAPAATPEPIEKQINTSITQTLKALKLEEMSIEDDEDEDDDVEQKSSFFSRFKRS